MLGDVLLRSRIEGRDLAVIGVAVLLPLLMAALVGYRALVNEDAVWQRGTEIELDNAAQRVRARVLGEVDSASEQLKRANIPADPERALGVVEGLMPKFAVAFVLVDGRLALPAPRRQAEPNAACEEAAARIAKRLSAAERDELSKRIVRECPDTRSVSGRYLLPILVLEDTQKMEPNRFIAWLEEHAPSTSDYERDAIARDIASAGWLDAALHERARRAISRPASDRDELAQNLAIYGAGGTFPWLDSEHRFSGGSGRLAVRWVNETTTVGFVVTPRSLARAMPELDLPSELVVSRRPPQGPHASAELGYDFTLYVGFADPRHVQNLTARSRRWLTASGIALGLLALAFGFLALGRASEVRHLSELRTDFVSTVSHELRTPVASVSMLAELLEQGRVDDSERREVYETLSKEARRLGDTIDRLLGFARISAKRVASVRRAVRVAEPVEESLSAFEQRQPGARIERSMDRELVAEVDPDQVRLAVDNLLGNALKYAPNGQPYRVVVEARKHEVWISVADHGPGVSARDRKRIFEPFERADDRLHRATEGSGIGLSLVRYVAESHGGRAWVESEPGGGACFIIALPRSVA